MSRYFPYAFLVPALFLILLLPRQLQGGLPYQVPTFTYVENIFMYLMFFVAFKAFTRKVRWTRPIFVFLALEMVASTVLSLCRGRMSVGTFVVVMAAVSLFTGYMWFLSPPFRRRHSSA